MLPLPRRAGISSVLPFPFAYVTGDTTPILHGLAAIFLGPNLHVCVCTMPERGCIETRGRSCHPLHVAGNSSRSSFQVAALGSHDEWRASKSAHPPQLTFLTLAQPFLWPPCPCCPDMFPLSCLLPLSCLSLPVLFFFRPLSCHSPPCPISCVTPPTSPNRATQCFCRMPYGVLKPT